MRDKHYLLLSVYTQFRSKSRGKNPPSSILDEISSFALWIVAFVRAVVSAIISLTAFGFWEYEHNQWVSQKG